LILLDTIPLFSNMSNRKYNLVLFYVLSPWRTSWGFNDVSSLLKPEAGCLEIFNTRVLEFTKSIKETYQCLSVICLFIRTKTAEIWVPTLYCFKQRKRRF
jgi:hypothetical protein